MYPSKRMQSQNALRQAQWKEMEDEPEKNAFIINSLPTAIILKKKLKLLNINKLSMWHVEVKIAHLGSIFVRMLPYKVAGNVGSSLGSWNTPFKCVSQ